MNPNVSDEPTVFSVGSHTVPVPIPGPAGPAPTLGTGETSSTTGAPSAIVREVGKDSYVIDFILKQGDQGRPGNPGATGFVAQATVEMIPYNQPASVVVSGTPPNQSMHFNIPKQTPTPGVQGPPGKLQNVIGAKPDDQDVVDLYLDGGPPESVLLKVLKSSATVEVNETADGVITFKVLGGGPAPEPFKPSQISYLNSSNVAIPDENPFIVPFAGYIPELGEPGVEVPGGINEYIVGSEKFIRVNVGMNIGATATPVTETISLFLAITVNEGFPIIPAMDIGNILPGAISVGLNYTTGIIPVTTGDKIQIMVQSSAAVGISGGSNMQIERFF